MGNLATLQKRMYAKASKAADAGNEAKKHVATEIVRYLVNITPVDTSQALSNWQASNGALIVFPVRAKVLGEGGSTQAVSAAKAFAEAQGIIEAAKPGQPIYLSNVLPYIRALDGGSSTQHPGGFVKASVIVGRLSLSNFKYDWS